MKQKIKLQGEIDKFTMIVEDLSAIISVIDKIRTHKISKNIADRKLVKV